MSNHLEINALTNDTLDRDLLESLAYSQRPKTKAERQKPIYYAMVAIGWFCQLISFVLASSGVLFQLVSNFKSSTGWVLIGLAVIFLAVNEVLVYIFLKEFHSERLDDKSVNKSTVLMLACSFCISAPVTYYYTPYAVTMFATAPGYWEIDLIDAEYNSTLDLETADINEQIIGADIMAKSIHDKNNRNGTTRSRAVKAEQAYIAQKLKLENLLISRKAEILAEKSLAIAAAESENETIKQGHEEFCSSFGGVLALVTVGAMFILFFVRWYTESWKRLYVAEGNVKLKEQDKEQDVRLETKVKESFRGKETVKDTDKQEVNQISFYSKDESFNRKEGDVLKGIKPKVDRVFVLKDNGDLKAYTKGGLNNLIKGSSESRRQYLEQLKLKLL